MALLAAAYGAKPFVVSELPETDWFAKVKRELSPVEAGRFFVYGSHDADQVPADCEPLLIEAAMALATGHHGTTRACLEALDRLDTGGLHGQSCGHRMRHHRVAMGAARICANLWIASDIDEVHVEVADANVVQTI